MSLSSILDSLGKVANKRVGGPDVLAGKNYDSNTFRYPMDVGSYDKGHYILFHINAQDTTQFGVTESGDTPTVIRNITNMQKIRGSTNVGGGVEMATDAVGQGVDAANNLVSAPGTPTTLKAAINKTVPYMVDALGPSIAAIKSISGQKFLRRIVRTTDTVALYMPDSLVFGYQQNYASEGLSGSLLSQFAAAGQSAVDSSAGGKTEIIKNLSPFLLNFATSKFLGNLGKPLFTAGTGMVQNPMMEVLYTSPKMRTFNFSFMFYPRSEQEAAEVQKIIDRFRFHQAPEIKSNSGGYFLVPPSEFDIKFMYFGKENPNIDKISTCVLMDIQVDYTKVGSFVAYESQGKNEPSLGGTGMPVGIGMTLSFKETQIITKETFALSDIPEDPPLGTATAESNAAAANRQSAAEDDAAVDKANPPVAKPE